MRKRRSKEKQYIKRETTFEDKSLAVMKRNCITMVISLFAIFLYLSLLSYSPLDNCLNVVGNQSSRFINYCGRYGAIVSDIMLQFFGLGSWIIPIIITFWCVIRTFSDDKIKLFRRLSFLMFALFGISTSLGFFKSYNFAMQMMPGGYVGYASSSLIEDNVGVVIGFLGSTLLFIVSFFFAVRFNIDNIFPFLMTKQTTITDKKIKHNIAYTICIKPIVIICSLFRQIIIGIIQLPALSKEILTSRENKKNASEIRKTALKELQKKEVSHYHNDKEAQKQAVPVVAIAGIVLETAQQTEENYKAPSTSLLDSIKFDQATVSEQEREKGKEELVSVLKDFGVSGGILSANSGPVVTLYEFKPEAGTKASRVIGISNDVARTLKVPVVRIADVPSRGIIGIELPNKKRQSVGLREILESQAFIRSKSVIPMVFGKDIMGEPVIEDLTKMPHLLIAGTTGSGKSVGLNSVILSIIYKMSPEVCKFIMIDPKMLELSPYEGIPHLLHPVLTDPTKAIMSLKWVVSEMTRRYNMMSSVGVRNIAGYNQKAMIARSRGARIIREIETGYDIVTGKIVTEKVVQDAKNMPYIVVIIDEMADLMIVAGKELESLVQRLAQMARAAGIHLIMATQRPSVDVITGVIKSNFPSRVAYQVASKIDSRTILGDQGAEQLLGKGDMLYSDVGKKPKRVHGPYVSEEEIELVVKYLKETYPVEYVDIMKEAEDLALGHTSESSSVLDVENNGKLYKDALEIIVSEGKTSISYIQRRLGIGYNKAANLIEKMEKNGVLSKPDRTGKRLILKNNNTD